MILAGAKGLRSTKTRFAPWKRVLERVMFSAGGMETPGLSFQRPIAAGQSFARAHSTSMLRSKFASRHKAKAALLWAFFQRRCSRIGKGEIGV